MQLIHYASLSIYLLFSATALTSPFTLMTAPVQPSEIKTGEKFVWRFYSIKNRKRFVCIKIVRICVLWVLGYQISTLLEVTKLRAVQE